MKNRFQINVTALQISFLFCCVCNPVLTIIKESNQAIHSAMNNLFCNHWLGQMIIMTTLFLLSVTAFQLFVKNRRVDFIKLLPLFIGISVLALFAFYVIKNGNEFYSTTILCPSRVTQSEPCVQQVKFAIVGRLTNNLF